MKDETQSRAKCGKRGREKMREGSKEVEGPKKKLKSNWAESCYQVAAKFKAFPASSTNFGGGGSCSSSNCGPGPGQGSATCIALPPGQCGQSSRRLVEILGLFSKRIRKL